MPALAMAICSVSMNVPAPTGDVADRVSILLLKQARIADPAAVAHVRRELDALRAAWQAEGLPALESLPEWPALCAVNTALWDVEDRLRAFEAEGVFDADFVAAARSVYRLNDERAALKRAVSRRTGSDLVEQKSYHGGHPADHGTA